MKPEKKNNFLFKEALELLKPGSMIVELGTLRDANPKAEFTDGWSTLRWLEPQLHYIWTVDNDSKSLHALHTVINDKLGIEYDAYLREYFKSVTSDAHVFLRETWPKIDEDIDLLYIDAPIGEDSINCFDEADYWMEKGALVLVDDVEENYTQRKELLIPHILSSGYEELLNNGRQSLCQKL